VRNSEKSALQELAPEGQQMTRDVDQTIIQQQLLFPSVLPPLNKGSVSLFVL
jgi:hypothetical protein